MRTEFEKYCNKRIVVRGFLGEFRVWTDFSKPRTTPTNAIQRPEVDGKILTDHIWLFHANKFKELGLKCGDYVKFEAEVKSYKRRLSYPNKNGLMVEYDFQLDYPSSVELLESANLGTAAEEIGILKIAGHEPVKVALTPPAPPAPPVAIKPEAAIPDSMGCYASVSEFDTASSAIRAALEVCGAESEMKDLVAFCENAGYDDNRSLRQMIHDERRRAQGRMPRPNATIRADRVDKSKADRIELMTCLETLCDKFGAEMVRKTVDFLEP